MLLVVSGASMFGIISWLIWKNRNETIFLHTHRSAGEIISTAMAWTKSLQAFGMSHKWSPKDISRNWWQKPSEGWIKVNVDGSLSCDRLTASIGGLGRDSSGRWLFGFQQRICASDILQIEATALLMGMQLAWRKGYKKVEFE